MKKKLSRDECRRITQEFKNEVMNCRSVEKAREIDKRVKAFHQEYDVPDEDNVLLQSGFGEALHMMTGYIIPV